MKPMVSPSTLARDGNVEKSSKQYRNSHVMASSSYLGNSNRQPSNSRSAWNVFPVRFWLSFLAAALAILFLRHYQITQLQNEAFSTGYLLLFLCVSLSLLGIRKRLVGSPLVPTTLGSIRWWQRMHHWLGCICLFCYLVHAGLWTRGWLDSLLGVLFWKIVFGGLISWYVNRTSPKLLQAAGESLLRSDISSRKSKIKEEAYRLALKCAGSGGSSAIADLYRSKLADYFQQERGLLYRINPNGKRRRSLVQEIDLLDRFLDGRGRSLKDAMIALVKQRDDLDFQLAIQNRIRFWSLFHRCGLGAFVVLATAHVVLAHLYSSHW